MKTPKPTIAGAAASPSAGYLRGEPGSGLYMPAVTPALRDRSEDVRAGWIAANSRANDAQMNSGCIAGVVEQVVALMIGTGLRLNHKPDGSGRANARR